MFERGKIILVPFPFTDLTSQKVRPALILSEPGRVTGNVIVAFITSKVLKLGPRGSVVVEEGTPAFEQTGLKVPSLIRCDKIATLDTQIVLGEIGSLSTSSMRKVNSALRFVLGLSNV
ncbi:MAG TPA: type II toxin-antitoxin system PemK/MazF family toxin [Patescibacteria group bacterium]|nr:type II toxin-antitoxin system PemK/MazF family toxin [Patescibacteria group bacterium]